VTVTGPNGFSQAAALSNISYSTDYRQVSVTYRVDAPGGSWDQTESGSYLISIQTNQVRDRAYNYVLAAELGSFSVASPASAPAAFSPIASASSTTLKPQDPPNSLLA
jgi:hypothetical protein